MHAIYSHLYFCQSLNRLQRGLSAIAELLVLQTVFTGDTRDKANVCNLFDGSIMAKPVRNCGGTITGIKHADMEGIKTASVVRTTP